jgi:hypothetical protein
MTAGTAEAKRGSTAKRGRQTAPHRALLIHEVRERRSAIANRALWRLRQWLRPLLPGYTQADGQLSKTDPDARSMATSGRGSGMVGYNVQVAVDAKHHLIVANRAVCTRARSKGYERRDCNEHSRSNTL